MIIAGYGMLIIKWRKSSSSLRSEVELYLLLLILDPKKHKRTKTCQYCLIKEFIKFLNSSRVASTESEVYITEATKKRQIILFIPQKKTRLFLGIFHSG